MEPSILHDAKPSTPSQTNALDSLITATPATAPSQTNALDSLITATPIQHNTPVVAQPKSYLSVMAKNVASIPHDLPANIAKIAEGGKPFTEIDDRDAEIAKNEAEQAAYINAPGKDREILGGLSDVEAARETRSSIGMSATTLPGGVAGGVLGAGLSAAKLIPGGRIPAAIAGAALGSGASGLAMGRAQENEVVRQGVAKGDAEQYAATGEHYTNEQKVAKQDEMLATGQPQKSGMHEAGWEALGTAVELAIALTPMGKAMKSVPKGMVGKYARIGAAALAKGVGAMGVEQATETATRYRTAPSER